MIDAELWIKAKRETEYHRGQIQGFLYGPNRRNMEGDHIVRDCTSQDNQVLWKKHGFKYDYDKIHIEMIKVIEIEQTKIIANRYDELTQIYCDDGVLRYEQ